MFTMVRFKTHIRRERVFFYYKFYELEIYLDLSTSFILGHR